MNQMTDFQALPYMYASPQLLGACCFIYYLIPEKGTPAFSGGPPLPPLWTIMGVPQPPGFI